MSHNHQKKIAVVNDLSGFGRCSIAVSLPIISAMGIQCCPVPTAIFSNHTGFDSFYSVDFTDHMEAYLAEWGKLDLRFRGILTGFLGSPEQLGIVSRFVDRSRSKDTIVIVDPVMGDYGKLYPTYSPKLAEGMRDLARRADILTPNLTEACILTGSEYRPDMGREELTGLCQKLSGMGPKKIVISGLERGEDLASALGASGVLPKASCRLVALGQRSGTGDTVMEEVARRLGEESEYALEARVGQVEPALVLVTSLLVGAILLSVMLPLMNIMTAIG